MAIGTYSPLGLIPLWDLRATFIPRSGNGARVKGYSRALSVSNLFSLSSLTHFFPLPFSPNSAFDVLIARLYLIANARDVSRN